MNVCLLFRDDQLVGVYSTRTKAEQVAVLLNTSSLTQIRIDKIEVDYPLAHLDAGESLFRVRWGNITSNSTRTVKALPIRSRAQEGDVSWNSARRTFIVAIWAVTQTAAEAEAETIRQNFITNNSL